MIKRPHVVSVRRLKPDECRFLTKYGCRWVATDSNGYRFGDPTEEGARKLALEYNQPTKKGKHT